MNGTADGLRAKRVFRTGHGARLKTESLFSIFMLGLSIAGFRKPRGPRACYHRYSGFPSDGDGDCDGDDADAGDDEGNDDGDDDGDADGDDGCEDEAVIMRARVRRCHLAMT